MKIEVAVLILAVVACVGGAAWAARGRIRSQAGPNGRAMYANLREAALKMTPGQLGLTVPADRIGAYGVLMELDIDGETATVVSYSSGDASLYLSTGGGVIGGGAHETVRDAAKALAEEAQSHLHLFNPAMETPRPRVGEVCFYVLTSDGVVQAVRTEQNLGEGRDELSPLFFAGQEVITRLRTLPS